MSTSTGLLPGKRKRSVFYAHIEASLESEIQFPVIALISFHSDLVPCYIRSFLNDRWLTSTLAWFLHNIKGQADSEASLHFSKKDETSIVPLQLKPCLFVNIVCAMC